MDGTPPTAAEGMRAGALARLSERIYAWRDRLIARPGFQAWAARFPLTAPVVRREALALFDLTAGFVYSQVLRAAVETGLLERLRDGPADAATLAPALDLSEEAAERLLTAAASLELLVRRRDGRYRLAQRGAALLGAPGLAEMIRHHALLYRDLSDPVALLKSETAPELARFWGYVGGERTHALSAEETAPYTRLMAATQALVAAEVTAAYRFTRHRHLLDLGGGNGSFLRAVAERAPTLRLTLFDLPAVAEAARARFAEAGLAERATAIGGDFFADPLPEGADAVSLVRVIYDHDDAFAARLLSKVRDALPPGGTLILAEPMAETPGAPRIGDAYFSFYILAMTHGRPRSARRLSELVAAAGFSDIKVLRTDRPFLTGLLTARVR